jgi:phage terminase large subunit
MNINAMPAQKGSGSLYFGIEKLKQFELFVYSRSTNLITELEAYKWATDKSGNYLRNTLKQLVPKAENPPKDHLIDAIRYGLSVYIDIQGLQQ